MSDQPTSLSLVELRSELSELRSDYAAFSGAYGIICRRIAESSELQPSRVPLLHEWSGSRATCGSLELVIHAIERTIHEYDELVRKVENGEIPNSDRPRFNVIDGGSL